MMLTSLFFAICLLLGSTAGTPISGGWSPGVGNNEAPASSSLTVSSTGPAATAQHSSMGVYFLTNEKSNNFPVYEKTFGVELYVNDSGYWCIWEPRTLYRDTIMHPENNPTPPSPPVTGWKYYDSGWKDDEQLTATQTGACVNDDRTRDTQGYNCTDHYDDVPEDCGYYNTRGFSAYRQCCACRRPHQPPGETTSKKPRIGHPGGFPSGKAETCQCGVENKNNEGSYDDLYPDEYGNDYILGGDVVSPNQYPWMVRLGFKGCGGSLISNRHVLTARHCVDTAWKWPGDLEPIDPNRNLVVWVGKHNIYNNQSGHEVPVQTAYWPDPHRADGPDIAMLVLKSPVKFSKTVQPICLPPPTNFESYARCPASSGSGYEYRQCGIQPVRALGWGAFGPNSGQHPTLKQLDPPAVYILDYDYPRFIHTSDNNISGQKEKPCIGDSGGPLMYQDQESKKWTLIGTLSGGGCTSAASGNFSSWVPVSAYYDWIQKHLSQDGTTTCAAQKSARR